MPLSKPTPPAAIDAVPSPVPQRTDRTNFAARGDAMMAWFETGVPQIGDVAAYVSDSNDFIAEQADLAETAKDDAQAAAVTATNASNVNGTSTTARTPALGSLTWVYVETNRAPLVGMRLRFASRANPATNYAVGIVTAWNSGTQTVTVTVDVVGNAPASASDWNVILDGERGTAGLTDTKFRDMNTVSSGTVTFDRTAGYRHQRVQAGGNIALAVTGWDPSGILSELMVECTNFGGRTITWPSGFLFVKYDGTWVSTPALAGYTLQASGTDIALLWTRDGGTSGLIKFIR